MEYRLYISGCKMDKFYKYFRNILRGLLLIFVISIIISPVKILYPDVRISTPDINKPERKTIEYRFRAINMLPIGSINFNVQFMKTNPEHPYYSIVPDYNSDTSITIAPGEIKSFSHKIDITTEDNRLINSLYQSIKVKVTDKKFEEWRFK